MDTSNNTIYFSFLIDSQIPEISPEGTVVIFLDGVGVTRDKVNYDLTDNRYGEAMVSAVENIFGKRLTYTCFQISDEISIIIDDITSFTNLIGAHYRTHDEICGLMAQTFALEFEKLYGHRTFFHIRIHCIGNNDRERYISWRKEYTKLAVYTYFAIHEGVWRWFYDKYNKDQLIPIMMREGIYDKLLGNRRYLEGRLLVVDVEKN